MPISELNSIPSELRQHPPPPPSALNYILLIFPVFKYCGLMWFLFTLRWIWNQADGYIVRWNAIGVPVCTFELFPKINYFFWSSYSKLLIPFLCLVKCRLLLLPLHSKITTHEQGNVFKKPEEGFRKVCKNTAYTHEIIFKISDL